MTITVLREFGTGLACPLPAFSDASIGLCILELEGPGQYFNLTAGL